MGASFDESTRTGVRGPVARARGRIIPGHGPLATKAELKTFRDMVAAIRDRVAALIEQGKSLQEVQAARPSKDFDAKWGGGFMKPEEFVGLVYQSLAKSREGEEVEEVEK